MGHGSVRIAAGYGQPWAERAVCPSNCRWTLFGAMSGGGAASGLNGDPPRVERRNNPPCGLPETRAADCAGSRPATIRKQRVTARGTNIACQSARMVAVVMACMPECQGRSVVIEPLTLNAPPSVAELMVERRTSRAGEHGRGLIPVGAIRGPDGLPGYAYIADARLMGMDDAQLVCGWWRW